LAARLESMTKSLHAPVLLDERATSVFRSAHDEAPGRLRRVARVRPYGMNQPLEVSELLPPATSSADLSDEQIAEYEAALDAFVAGDWSGALDKLHRVPAIDRVKD